MNEWDIKVNEIVKIHFCIDLYCLFHYFLVFILPQRDCIPINPIERQSYKVKSLLAVWWPQVHTSKYCFSQSSSEHMINLWSTRKMTSKMLNFLLKLSLQNNIYTNSSQGWPKIPPRLGIEPPCSTGSHQYTLLLCLLGFSQLIFLYWEIFYEVKFSIPALLQTVSSAVPLHLLSL